MILPRYLYRQALTTSAMTLVVLMGVVSALFLAELLSQAAQGQLPGFGVLALLVLKLPEAILMVAPLALLVGVLFALGQAHESGEITIARASGVSYWVCFRPLMGLALAWSVGVLVMAGWVLPWTVQQTGEVMADVAQQALVASLQPGQFDRFDQGRVTLYVAGIDSQDGQLRDVFLQHSGHETEEMVSAPTGRLWQDPADQSRYLSLSQGHQIRRDSDGGLMQLSFAQNDVRLPPPAGDGVGLPEMALSLPALTPPADSAERREWHWRLASPIGTLLLGILAIPLAWRTPRGGPYGSVVVAVVVYLVYSNWVHVGLVWMEGADALTGPGLWPIHGALAILVAGFWTWRWRQW